jgi:allantoin racemase
MKSHKRKIKMILPVPLPPEALAMFERQIPNYMKRTDIQIDFVAVKNGGKILDSYYETTLADSFVLQAGQLAEEEGYDAICVNSMSDSGLNALRSLLTIPVVGPCQSSILMACSLGDKFSILTMWDRWDPMYKKTINEQGLNHRLASIRNINTRPDAEELLAGKEEIVFSKLLEEANLAIKEDNADVIILGSTTMYQSYEFLKSELPIPVLNPGLIALKMCELQLDLGISHSKKTYISPEQTNYDAFDGVKSIFKER